MAYSSIIGVRHNLERTPFDAKQAASALWEGKWEAILPIVLVIGLATGMLRIHEAAAFTALYVLVVEVFVYRDIDLKDIPRIGVDCVVLVGAILIILATAIGFTAYLIQANVPQTMLDYMEAFIGSRWAFLLALNVFLVLVGMTMDIFSAIVVVVPLIVPIASHFGINPYHLGAIFLLNLEIGYLTPPLGLNLFISGFRFNRSLPEVYRSVVPFILILGGALALVTYVPALSTWSSKLHDEAIDLSAPSEPEPAAAPEGSGGSGGETLEDLMKGEDEPIDLGGPAKEGETLDDLMHQGKEGETPEDLTGQGKEGETLDDLMHEGKEGETLEDLMGKAGAPSAP
jgi:hypothetical protein